VRGFVGQTSQSMLFSSSLPSAPSVVLASKSIGLRLAVVNHGICRAVSCTYVGCGSCRRLLPVNTDQSGDKPPPSKANTDTLPPDK